MSLKQGSIVWVVVSDQAGRNPKCRPAVVVTPTDDIVQDASFVIIAATSTFSSPLPDNRIELPWHPARHPVTGLYKRCVAVCDWLTETTHDKVQGEAGVVPPGVLARILQKIPRPSCPPPAVAGSSDAP